ncbi:MAG: hypothetical protein ACOCQG_02950 [Candidatus Nanoarchaeia archaeon]
MKDSTLLSIAVIVGLVGLAVLYFVSERTEPEEFENLQRHDEDEIVKLSGKVKDIIKTESVTILEVETLKSIKVVAFEPIELNKGQQIQITGKISEYEGEREIMAERIE